MSTQHLREELERIAAAAPIAEVPHDTWARGRRSLAGRRLLAGAAAVAVLATVVGVVAWPEAPPDPPVAGSSTAGVPDHLYAVPGRMSAQDDDGDWLRDQVTDDLAVGRAAAAWLSTNGLPVVVGAADGAYHLLDLPDLASENLVVEVGSHPAAITLSPDGARLAYSWATFGADAASAPIPSGIRVLDLQTGEVTDHPLPGEEGTAVTAIAWSDDGRWLGWTGARMGSWTTSSMGRATPVAGRVHLTDGTRQEFSDERLGPTDVAVAVDDRGRLSLFSPGSTWWWHGGAVHQRRNGDLGAVRTGQAPSDGSGAAAVPTYDTYALPIAASSGAVQLLDLGSPRDEPWQVQPLAWVGDSVLVATDAADGAPGRLLLVDAGSGQTRVVGTTDIGSGRSLSVATHLVTGDRPTVERPAPDWPWSDERKVVVGGLAALGLLLAGWGAVRAVRRRRLSS